MSVEIIIFEYNEVYGAETISVEEGIDTFIKTCLDYIPEGGEFGVTSQTIYYSESVSVDKPKTIMMICKVTDEWIERIKERL